MEVDRRALQSADRTVRVGENGSRFADGFDQGGDVFGLTLNVILRSIAASAPAPTVHRQGGEM